MKALKVLSIVLVAVFSYSAVSANQVHHRRHHRHHHVVVRHHR